MLLFIRSMNYFKAGKLVAVHGLKGELVLKHELGKKSSLKDVKAIFIEDRKNSFLPWFIESAKAKSGNEILLKLESVNTREAAAKLSQKEIWLTEEDFKRLSAKAAPATKPEETKAASAGSKAAPAESGSQGRYFVQVGAFVEAHNAEALSKQLRAEKFPVTISRVSRGGHASAPAPAPAAAKPEAGGQNQLFITGSTPDAVNAALKGKGTAQPVKGGLVVNPPYDLETAMSLSSSLKKEGFKVVIRRAKAAPAAAAPSGGTGGTTFHVVRVGGYPDRAKAQQVRSELETKGHPGFLTQGAAR